MVNVEQGLLCPAREFEGKNILLTGTTGFLGKVVLSLLLHDFPTIGRIYALIRPGIQAKSKDRFARSVVPSAALTPLRRKYGDRLDAMLAEKVVPVDGNVVKEGCGIGVEDLTRFRESGLDLIINSAGLVDFDPAVDQALGINVHGAENVVNLARDFDAGLVHVSTCYVNGGRAGDVLESREVLNYFPRSPEKGEEDFDYRSEIDHLASLAAEVRVRAKDPVVQSLFRERALDLLLADGPGESDSRALKSGLLRQRKMWIAGELKRIGMDRARHWGWQNTYTFTKSLGEQIIAAAQQAGTVRASVVRPAIVESAYRFPFPGWNEGFTTTAPLILMAREGLREFPYAEDLVLDVIPVDMVASTIVGAAVAVLGGREEFVYQAASGAVNPLTIKKAIEFTGFGVREHAARKPESGLKGFGLRNHEMQPVTEEGYHRWGAPRVGKLARSFAEAMERVGPNRFGWGQTVAERLSTLAAGVEADTVRVEAVMDLFLPFVAGDAFIFRSENTRRLMQSLSLPEGSHLSFDPESFVWRDYFRDVHVPGLEKWVFPRLEEELADKSKSDYVCRNLVELFTRATGRYRHRIAFEFVTEAGSEHLTFGQVRTLALRSAGFLDGKGCEENDRVVLISENRCEWAAVYFGAQWAGVTVVPVDAAATLRELQNIVSASGATGVIASPKVRERLQRAGLHGGGLPGEEGGEVPVWEMSEVVNSTRVLEKSRGPARLASILFTSGTTGKPKGVMLSQRNFTFEVSRLGGVFDLGKRDHLLSVLPIHHTFEFTAGLLVPFSRGAKVTYLEELTPSTLGRALEGGVSGLIGVPALWELLRRRVETRSSEAGPLGPMILEGVRAVNLFLREELNINLGPVAAYPVHRALGGRLNYLVSGGSALNPEVMEFFRGLGFDLREGYGLTETAPVLTVSNPGEAYVPGSVGKCLPGVEVRIDAPNGDGVGEVCARGPNVMQGYYGEEAATREVLVDGWLRTGDLGRLDAEGNLFILGRSKDVIVDRDGRNVYPDELEEVYGGHAAISELSVVGLVQPDGNEKVACLVVPKAEVTLDDELLLRSEEGGAERRRELIRAHFRAIHSSLPFYKRVKALHFQDGELPRTSTRKIKRAEVRTRLERLEEISSNCPKPGAEPMGAEGAFARACEVVSSVRGGPGTGFRATTRLAADLGFDSLMLVELAGALEGLVPKEGSNEALAEVETVGDVAALLGRGVSLGGARVSSRHDPGAIIGFEARGGEKTDESYEVPLVMKKMGKRLLGWGQRQFYEVGMECEVRGKQYVPTRQNFLVAANHCSHLDAGLVKQALGRYGKNLVTLAAKDYFFGSKLRRTFFENFTNVVPIERHGSVKQSLRRALAVLMSGRSLLIFPEGTRSEDGGIGSFKSSVGYLAIQSKRSVLPMYLQGTYEAMPKGGALLPASRDLRCVIGAPLKWEYFQTLSHQRARSEGTRLGALLVERAVWSLKEKGGYKPQELFAEVLGESGDSAARPRSGAGELREVGVPDPEMDLEQAVIFQAALEGAGMGREVER